MNIIKPIYVYKWVNGKEYIKYVFDTNQNNYNTSVKVIKENIYQDSTKEDALNKIAYYINRLSSASGSSIDDKNPYYAWVNNKPFLYEIGTVKWKGFNVNPFKSTDKKSEVINETIEKKYNKDLFETTDIINIVFKSDFDFDNKYYYDIVKFKSNNYKTISDTRIGELYKHNIINSKKIAEEYYNVVFSDIIENIPSLIIIFDKLATNSKIQLIQYINNNFAYYKLYKRHTFKNRKTLNRIFKLNSDGKECINMYYTKNIVITIYANGIINLTFHYPIDNGVIISEILKYVEELNKYINKVLNININFKVKNINARIKFNAYKTKYDDLKNEIKTSTIFTELKEDEFYYKRTSNYNDRSVIDKNIKDDVNNNNIKINVKEGDIQDTKIIVKKENRGYMFDVKNAKTFFEFECLEYWILKIIERAIDDKKSTEDITDKQDDKNDKDDDTPPNIPNRYMSTSSESSGGNNNTKKYLINKLKNADKEIWGDKNKSRKCQKIKQPIPLSTEEYNDLKQRGLNKFCDNSIIHNNNYYICPRLWCPKSNVPLDESDPLAKCPISDEEPMRLNDEMKNKNLPRYVYLKKIDNIPCCGKKFNEGIDDDADDDEDEEAGAAKPTKPVKPPTKPTPAKAAKAAKADLDKNYIMKNYPIYYNKRFGDIPEELYKILYPENYKEYLESCRSPNNINKKKCILRKGLIDIDEIPDKYGNRYDNIINTIAYLVDETKETFVENIKNKIDILTYISLDNGNICKDFGDYEPVLYEYNKELYRDLKIHLNDINKKNEINIELPNLDSKDEKVKEKALFKISRLLYIYKSYRKFLEYISADNYPDDKGVQYLYSLIAFVYKKLLIVWENTINTSSIIPSIDLLAPEYINDIISYYGLQKKTEIIMVLKEKWKANGNKDDINKHRDNKLYEIMKDRDNINFYEPLIIKTINMEKKHMALSEYPNIKKIINYQPNNNIFNNLKYINNLIKDETLDYSINTIIINDNYTIDKIMLKNNILIRFNPQGTIILPYLIWTT